MFKRKINMYSKYANWCFKTVITAQNISTDMAFKKVYLLCTTVVSLDQ